MPELVKPKFEEQKSNIWPTAQLSQWAELADLICVTNQLQVRIATNPLN